MYPHATPSVVVTLDVSNATLRITIPSKDGTTTVDDLELAKFSLADSGSDEERYRLIGKVALDALRTLGGASQTSQASDNEEAIERLIEPRAKAGDVRAIRIMATFAELRAIRTKQPALLEQVEAWHRQAVVLGDKEAEQFLANKWTKHKALLLAMIASDGGLG